MNISFAGLAAVIIGPLILLFWLWMLVDAIKNPRLSSNQRLLWVLIILFVNWLGALIYFFAGRDGSGEGDAGGNR